MKNLLALFLVMFIFFTANANNNDGKLITKKLAQSIATECDGVVFYNLEEDNSYVCGIKLPDSYDNETFKSKLNEIKSEYSNVDYSSEWIDQVLQGEKTISRILVSEGEYIVVMYGEDNDKALIVWHVE